MGIGVGLVKPVRRLCARLRQASKPGPRPARNLHRPSSPMWVMHGVQRAWINDRKHAQVF
jgi:hypothetical protein